MSNRTELMNSFIHGTPKRTMGSETEYTTGISQSLLERVDERLVAYYNDKNELWMKNGARLYIDFGKLVEYATPECTSGHQVLLHERVGQLAVRNVGDTIITTASVNPLTDELETMWRQIPTYKRTGYGLVTIGEGDDEIQKSDEISTGHHETYQTGLDAEDLDINRGFLEAYLATRIVWSGTGMVTTDGYQLSQKADAIDFQDGNDRVAHGLKIPFIYKGAGLVEIRTGEGNMSDWAIVQKFDMTSLVLRMMEHDDMPNQQLIIRGLETATFRAASRNPVAPVPSNVELLDAVEVQCVIAEHALQFAQRPDIDVPRAEINAAKQVLKACKQIHEYYFDDRDLSTLSDRIDWAAKLDKLRSRGISLGEITCANLVAVAHDLSWEDISYGSASERWYKARQKSVYSESDLRRHAMIPPSERARSRIDLIDSHEHQITRVDWDIVTLKDDSARYVEPSPWFKPSRP